MSHGNDKPLIAKNFAPVTYPGTRRIDVSGTERAGYDRVPRLDDCSFQAGNLLVGPTPYQLVIPVQGPALFRVLQAPELGAEGDAGLDLWWRSLGESGGNELGFTPQLGQRMPFVGPYAYFPRAGIFEVSAMVTGFIDVLLLNCEMQHGITAEEWAALASGLGSRFVSSYTTGPIAAATPQNVILNEAFMTYRRLLLTNHGPNRLQVSLGGSDVNNISAEVNESIEIDEAFLGRHTVELAAEAATVVVGVTLSTW